MTVGDLIEKLREYPVASELCIRLVGLGDKMIMVADGHELDPILQFHKPTVHGYGPMNQKEKEGL